MRRQWATALEQLRVERELALDGYARIVADLGRSADRATLTAEAGVVARETEARGVPELRPFLDVAARHAADSRDRGLPPRDRLREEVLAAARGAAPPQAAAPAAPVARPPVAARPPVPAQAPPASPPVAVLPPPPPPPVTADPEPNTASRPSLGRPPAAPPRQTAVPPPPPPAREGPGISVKPPIQRGGPSAGFDPTGRPLGTR
jgi:hypothetical protein